MRTLVFLLVLANLLFYAFSHGLFGAEAPLETASTQEISPQQVRILSRGEPPDANAAAEKTDTAPATAEADTNSAANAATPEPALAAKLDPVCLEWPGLPDAEKQALRQLAQTKFPAFVWKETPPPTHGWWVYIPPQASRAAADKKASELKALGIKDYFIVQEGTQRNALSLGIFSSEKSAGEHLASLRAQGVRSAMLAPRPDKNDAFTVRLRGPGEQQAALRAAVGETAAFGKFPAQDCR